MKAGGPLAIALKLEEFRTTVKWTLNEDVQEWLIQGITLLEQFEFILGVMQEKETREKWLKDDNMWDDYEKILKVRFEE